MISIQKSAIGFNNIYKKLYPSINFLDPMTIQSWDTMRHLIYDYGIPYRFRY
jgi:hypothetical protein